MIFGIHGKKGSGKDEFFRTVQKIDNDYNKTAFADKIKDEVMGIFGLYDERDYDYFKRNILTYDEREVEGREVVRGIGMLMRGYDENQFNEYVKDMIILHPKLVVTDVRFRNEMDLMEPYIRVKIKRDLPDDEHITEVVFDDEEFDYVIENNGTIEEFRQKVRDVYQTALKTNKKQGK